MRVAVVDIGTNCPRLPAAPVAEPIPQPGLRA
jgi:hypothetical protein